MFYRTEFIHSLLLTFTCVYFVTNIHPIDCADNTDDIKSKQLLEWEAPEEVQKKYPYFLTGFDKEGSPVWVIQYGKWDVRQTIEEGKLSDELEKWTEQMWERISDTSSVVGNSTDQNEDGYQEYTGIADMLGYDLRQLTHVQTVQKHLTLVRQFATVVQKKGNFKKAIVINSNFLFQSLWNLIRPLLGGIASSIELYGSNVDTWKPVLLKIIDKQQLPEWLGGVKDHQPVKVYG